MNDRIVVLAVLAITLIVGSSISVAVCAAAGEGSASEDSCLITITDLDDRTVTIDGPVESVVLADAEAINVFAAVGGPDFIDYLSGVCSALDTNYPDLLSAYSEDYPQMAEIPRVGDLEKSTFSVEEVVTLNPDVVILPLWCKTYGMVPDIGPLDKAGIPVVYVDFYLSPYGGDSYERSVSLIGTLLGKEETADQIIDYYSRQVEDIFSRVKDIDSDFKTTVYIEYPNSGADQYGITMSHSGMALPIDYSGGKNIADDVIARSGQINPEYLINADPDVIVFCMVPGTLTDSGGNIVGFGSHPSQDEVDKVIDEYTDRSGWSSLKAVKDGNVYFYYSGLGFSIENFVILQSMAKWFYPDEFSDIEPIQNMREFYDRFMPIPLDGTWYFNNQEILSSDGR